MAISHIPLLLFLSILLNFSCGIAASDELSLQFHHYFSDAVRQWEESHGVSSTWQGDVPRGSPDYYRMLINHDLHRNRGRFLAEGDLYSFTNEGNKTTQYLNLLHYAIISLGTPSQTFLVMLDTGSHLFWVPCKCRQCAPNTSPSYGNVEFHNYMPNTSSTSKTITCSSSQCDMRFRNICLNSSGDCTYSVNYAMADTSSTGILMQDVLSFMNERNTKDVLQLPIIFGCGQVQTGALLRNMPNGLMGLGLDSLAVPSMLAKNKTISDSFSMCFGNDGTGRLRFGDKGNFSQNETPLVVYKGLPYYNINITEIVVGNISIKEEFTILVDSGTNFALLQDPLYTQFAEAFSSQIEDKRIVVSNVPLDYCYESNSNDPVHPSVSFTTKGGGQFPMLAPIIGLVDENSNLVAYCLAVVKSSDNVIGAIAMTGLNVVYDREKLVLGWQEADCYGSFKKGTTKNTSSPPPAAPLPSPPQKPSNSWALRVSALNLLNILMCLFVIGLPLVFV